MRSLITKVCVKCGNDFEAVLAKHKRGGAKYCSFDCFRFKGEKRNCVHCNTEFHTNSHVKDKKYCPKGS